VLHHHVDVGWHSYALLLFGFAEVRAEFSSIPHKNHALAVIQEAKVDCLKAEFSSQDRFSFYLATPCRPSMAFHGLPMFPDIPRSPLCIRCSAHIGTHRPHHASLSRNNVLEPVATFQPCSMSAFRIRCFIKLWFAHLAGQISHRATLHATLLQDLKEKTLMAAFANDIASDNLSVHDIRAAAMIMQRNKSGLPPEQVIIRSLVHKQQMVNNSRRKSTRVVPGVSEESLARAGFKLAAKGGSNAIMKFFALNPKGVCKYRLQHPVLPDFYTSVRSTPTLEEAGYRARELCCPEGTRNFMVTFDATPAAPGHELIYTLRPEPGLVGCEWNADPEKDFSFQPRGPNAPAMDLNPEHLAPDVLNFLLSSIDSNKFCWDFAYIPIKPSRITKEWLFKMLGWILQCLAKRNRNVPAMGSCSDNHGTMQWCSFKIFQVHWMISDGMGSIRASIRSLLTIPALSHHAASIGSPFAPLPAISPHMRIFRTHPRYSKIIRAPFVDLCGRLWLPDVA